MNIETLIIEYSNKISDNSPYEIDRKNNRIYINPVYNDVISISYSLFSYLGYSDFDTFYSKYRSKINEFAMKLK